MCCGTFTKAVLLQVYTVPQSFTPFFLKKNGIDELESGTVAAILL